jgi:hypothetical protein
MRENDPMTHLDTAHVELEENQYKAEIELADRYQSFTAELLRLSLLGIAVFGFLYKEIFLNLESTANLLIPCGSIGTVKSFAGNSILSFGVCALFSLIFRYFSTESTRLYLEALRFQISGDRNKAELKLKRRIWVVRVCIASKAGAVIGLSSGAVFVALMFKKLLA